MPRSPRRPQAEMRRSSLEKMFSSAQQSTPQAAIEEAVVMVVSQRCYEWICTRVTVVMVERHTPIILLSNPGEANYLTLTPNTILLSTAICSTLLS